jgi:hypothetical protein
VDAVGNSEKGLSDLQTFVFQMKEIGENMEQMWRSQRQDAFKVS